MSPLLLAFAVSAACPTFTFVGQPACVDLRFDDGVTRLENRCESLLLVDQSVALDGSVVAPGASATLRDLNRFTLAVDGKLYGVLATVPDEPTCK